MFTLSSLDVILECDFSSVLWFDLFFKNWFLKRGGVERLRVPPEDTQLWRILY